MTSFYWVTVSSSVQEKVACESSVFRLGICECVFNLSPSPNDGLALNSRCVSFFLQDFEDTAQGVLRVIGKSDAILNHCCHVLPALVKKFLKRLGSSPYSLYSGV